MSFGLTENGLVIPSVDTIREGLKTNLRNMFGSSLDLGDKSILGQLVGIIAERIHELWEKLEAVNSSQDPDKATGASLDGVSALTGTFRPAATFSTVVLTLTGTALTLVQAGSKAKTSSTQKIFITLADGTLTALTAWAASTAYALGDRVSNASRSYECISPGTSAGSGGPTTTASDITDNTVHWTYLGEGTAAVDVNARAETSGPVTAAARDISAIESPVGGWSSVINLLDASSGRNRGEDGELRLLREQELAAGGNTTPDAILAELLEIVEVEAATVFYNNGDVTDADGVPPHSVEALVRIAVGAANDQLIFNAMFDGAAAGIRTHGTTSGTAVDDQGVAQVIKFTRPTEVPIYASLMIKTDSLTFPSDGVAQVKQAIVDWGDIQTTGKDAVASGVAAQAFRITGLLEVVAVGIDTALLAAPTTWLANTAYVIGNVVANGDRMYECITNGTSAASGGPTTTAADITDNTAHWKYLGGTIAITRRQLAVFDTSRINITASTATP
jgi:uncharacterized phage protein gp47/JayE